MKKESARMPAALLDARRDFESWRADRTGRRIPEGLWKRATVLAGRYGICRTARILRLDYANLKRRVAVHNTLAKSPVQARRPFVEVHPSTVLGGPQCAVEVEYPDGMKMRIALREAAGDAMRAVGDVVWRRRS